MRNLADPDHDAGSPNRTGDSSKTIGVALVGLGRWGTKLAQRLAQLADCQLVVVCDRDPDRLRGAELPRHTLRCAKFEDALAHPGVTACVIASPAYAHATQAIAALSAGKHVFVEKPMALCAKDALAITMTASSTGMRVMVGHILHYDPWLAEVRSTVERGGIGAILHITAERFNVGPASTPEGVWWNLAPHDISFVIHLCRDAPSRIAARPLALRGCRGEAVESELSFPSGAGATIRVASGHQERLRSLRITGSRGTLTYSESSSGARIRLTRPREPTPNETQWAIQSIRPPPPADGADTITLELQHFIRAVQTGTQPMTDGRHGARVVEILERAQLDYATDRITSTTR